ncbi:MAG: enoyl-CoA hydratase-related protein [Bacteroidia bacterium]|nr:enoyl-CoA hydratase-related protein [Bacteroidia bacterium]
MNYYPKELIEEFTSQKFAFLEIQVQDRVCHITLDRAEKKNAIHPQMVNELAFVFQYVMENKEIWMILLGAKGDVFCSGADLKAFMGMGGSHDSSIPKPENEILIGPLFQGMHKPIITKLAGNVFAGGMFFLTGAHIVLAADHVTLGLPEVKRGLYPFQVMAELQRVMPKRKVLEWCIRGYSLPVQEATELGLITACYPAGQLDDEVAKVIEEMKGNSPTAIQLGIKAFQKLNAQDSDHVYLRSMLAKAVSSADGQEGLRAFKEKRKAVWKGE